MSKDGWNRFKFGGKWAYDVSKLGYKYNMTDISASFGIWQMNYVNVWHSKRKKIITQYREYFSSIDGVKMQDKKILMKLTHFTYLSYQYIQINGKLVGISLLFY